jgi:RNA-directed DNA polymerase
MLDNVPMDKAVLRKWLKSGYMEDTVLYPTEKGTPQGGLISPVLANMALDGLEEVARGAVPSRISVKGRSTRSKVHVVRYADDFIVTAHSREMLEEGVIPAIKSFLEARGLNISALKSKITHIETGFDFLGAHVRKYGRRGKFLIQPRKDNELGLVRDLREFAKRSWSARTGDLIRQLNSKIRGWANYFRPYCSSQAFHRIDDQVFVILWRWARHRHKTKGAQWVATRYYRSRPNRPRVFYTTIRDRNGLQRSLELVKASSITIRRHAKIRAEANVFDPEHAPYFAVRRRKQREARMEDRRHRRRWMRGELEYAA